MVFKIKQKSNKSYEKYGFKRELRILNKTLCIKLRLGETCWWGRSLNWRNVCGLVYVWADRMGLVLLPRRHARSPERNTTQQRAPLIDCLLIVDKPGGEIVSQVTKHTLMSRSHGLAACRRSAQTEKLSPAPGQFVNSRHAHGTRRPNIRPGPPPRAVPGLQ